MAGSEPMVDISKDQTGQENADPSFGARPSDASKIAARRTIGFIFWINAMVIVFLLIGYVAPGWWTAKVSQKMYYIVDEPVRYKEVLEDYGLWYITKCEFSNEKTDCETLSYRLIDLAGSCYECKSLEIGDLKRNKSSEILVFSGAGLVFSISEIHRMQALYTVGLILALTIFRKWYKYRKHLAETGMLKLTKTKWVFLLFVAALTALFVFIPVVMFGSISGEIGRMGARVKTPVGSVFAGFGGAMMILTGVVIVLQLVCNWHTDDAYLCNCWSGNNKKARRRNQNA